MQLLCLFFPLPAVEADETVVEIGKALLDVTKPIKDPGDQEAVDSIFRWVSETRLGSGWGDAPMLEERTALLVDTGEEGGVAGIVANRVEERVNTNKSHVEAMLVECSVEGIECVGEFADAKIVDADLVRGAGFV